MRYHKYLLFQLGVITLQTVYCTYVTMVTLFVYCIKVLT